MKDVMKKQFLTIISILILTQSTPMQAVHRSRATASQSRNTEPSETYEPGIEEKCTFCPGRTSPNHPHLCENCEEILEDIHLTRQAEFDNGSLDSTPRGSNTATPQTGTSLEKLSPFGSLHCSTKTRYGRHQTAPQAPKSSPIRRQDENVLLNQHIKSHLKSHQLFAQADSADDEPFFFGDLDEEAQK